MDSELVGAASEVHAPFDVAIRLPMCSGARPLNVALAAAIALGEALC